MTMKGKDLLTEREIQGLRCQMTPQQREDFISQIATMSRRDLVRSLRGMPCAFDLDFTDDCLESMELDRLRHVVLAASLHAKSTVRKAV